MADYRMKMLLPSGYRSIVGEECSGCGLCVRYCQFGALEMVEVADNGSKGRICRVISERCFGCGVCEGKCSNNAIHLVLDPEKGVPLNIEALSPAEGAPSGSLD